MLTLLSALQLLCAGQISGAVAPDGGEVPVLAPQLAPKLTPLLAPELAPDGGGPVTVAPTLTAYAVDLPIELTLTGGSLAFFLMVDLLVKPTLEGDVSCRNAIGDGRCDPADLSAIDRVSVGKSSKEWQLFSDVAVVASLVAPALYLGLESLVLPTNSPLKDWAGDMLVVSEAIAVAGAFQVVLKFVVRRPRPVRYLPVSAQSGFDNELSFPSGHTSLVASATSALTATVFLRHPDSMLRFVVLGLGLGLTALTAAARVEAGQHFPTDVFVGALVGGFAGFAVPYLHRKKLPIRPLASINPLNGQSVIGVTGSF